MTVDPNTTLWEGAPQTLTSAATGGKVQGTKYRLTPLTLHIDKGLVRSDSQQIQLANVHDVDVSQSMSQKARSVGDVRVHCEVGTNKETVTLESIKDPKAIRDLINETVLSAKRHFVEESRTQVNVGSVEAPVAAPAAAPVDVAEQLIKLAGLRDAGILSPEEFDAQKARLLA